MNAQDFLAAFGAPDDAQRIDPREAARFAGRVPDDLAAFWVEHGIGAYAGGLYHLCLPDRFDLVLAHVLTHAPDLRGQVAAVGHSAFGMVDLWHAAGRHLALNLPFAWFDDQSSRRETEPVPHDAAELFALAGVPMPEDPHEMARMMKLPPLTVWDGLATGASAETYAAHFGADGRPLPAAVAKRLGPAGPDRHYLRRTAGGADLPEAYDLVALAEAPARLLTRRGTLTRAIAVGGAQEIVTETFPLPPS